MMSYFNRLENKQLRAAGARSYLLGYEKLGAKPKVADVKRLVEVGGKHRTFTSLGRWSPNLRHALVEGSDWTLFNQISPYCDAELSGIAPSIVGDLLKSGPCPSTKPKAFLEALYWAYPVLSCIDIDALWARLGKTNAGISVAEHAVKLFCRADEYEPYITTIDPEIQCPAHWAARFAYYGSFSLADDPIPSTSDHAVDWMMIMALDDEAEREAATERLVSSGIKEPWWFITFSR